MIPCIKMHGSPPDQPCWRCPLLIELAGTLQESVDFRLNF